MSYDERSYYAGQQEGRRESEAKIRDLQAALKTAEYHETKFRREIEAMRDRPGDGAAAAMSYDEARYIEMCRLTEENRQLQSKIDNLLHTMEQMRSQGALMVHALDRALQYNEALFSFWPPDTPMHPDVSACKAQYNEAMEKVFQRRGERDVGADHD